MNLSEAGGDGLRNSNVWHKCTIRIEYKDIYDVHDNNYVNYIAECNLLHDILNPSKIVKSKNPNYYPILHGCINTRRGKARFIFLNHIGY